MQRPFGLREVNGELKNPMTFDFDLFVPFCHRSLLGRLVSHKKKSIGKDQAYMFYEMISGLIYAMPCIVFVCVY